MKKETRHIYVYIKYEKKYIYNISLRNPMFGLCRLNNVSGHMCE